MSRDIQIYKLDSVWETLYVNELSFELDKTVKILLNSLKTRW